MNAILTTLFVLLAFSAAAKAEPADHWQSIDPVAAPWISGISTAVQDYARKFKPTAMMILHDGRAAVSAGDVTRKLNVASIRKSLLGALYGIAISEKRINPAATLGQLGIDDAPQTLTDTERQATVRDLLMARSGIYLPAAYETADMEQKRPARGSHKAGEFWFYNNWDFNALGTIYRQATGEDIFQSFERRVARPIGMEDFSSKDGRYVLDPASKHPAYPFHMSTRDLARFGLLFENGGRWRNRQIVPAHWVGESTTAHSATDRKKRGYGFLWWVLDVNEWGAGAALASGHGGQLVAVIPTRRIVMVQTIASDPMSGRPHTADFLSLLRKVMDAAP